MELMLFTVKKACEGKGDCSLSQGLICDRVYVHMTVYTCFCVKAVSVSCLLPFDRLRIAKSLSLDNLLSPITTKQIKSSVIFHSSGPGNYELKHSGYQAQQLLLLTKRYSQMAYCLSGQQQLFDETTSQINDVFSCVFSDGPEAAPDIYIVRSRLLQ